MARISVHVFFKNIKINGLENLKPGEPILIAANHNNAFMDAIVLQVFAKQKVHSLARSDVFNTKLKRWLLGKLHMQPIYRIQEGSDNLHKNAETFQICNQILKKKQSIIMFPEGVCIQQKKLCKLKKGMARIVFGAMEYTNYDLNIKVIPVGINYSTPSRFGGNLLINIGKPIYSQKYKDAYLTDKVKTMNQFTADVEQCMEKLIIHVENKSNEAFYNDIEKIVKPELLKNQGVKENNLEKDFEISQLLAQFIEEKSKNNIEQFEALKKKTQQYIEQKKKHGIKDWHLNLMQQNKATYLHLFQKLILLTLFFPLFLIGTLFNYIPFKTPYWLSKKIVKNIEFFSSINLGFGMFLFLIYYALLAILIGNSMGNASMLIAFLIASPLSGLFALNYWSIYKDAKGILLLMNKKSQAKELTQKRKEVVDTYNQLIL